MKSDEFKKFFKAASEYYRIALTADSLDSYWDDLNQFSISEIRNAFRQHRIDEKRGGYFPLVSDLIKYVDKTEKQKIKIIYCNHNDSGKLCANEAKHFLGNQKMFCEEHFEKNRSKSEWENNIDVRVKQIEEKAKELGMTNEEYFRHSNPNIFKKTENNSHEHLFKKNNSQVKSYSNVVDLMSKLAGK